MQRSVIRSLERFLLRVIDSKSCSFAYINGEFTTAKPAPKAIDVILQTRRISGPEAFRAIEPFLRRGHDAIREKYSVCLYFWSEEILDFREFFQFVRPEEAMSLPFVAGPRKGIVRIRL
jgi:hypothetical protein